MSKIKKQLSRLGIVVAATVGLGTAMATTAGAVPLLITSSPQENAGNFVHNVFHTAHRNNGSGGDILAWYDLDTGGVTDKYDPISGNFQADFKIFSDSALNSQIGTVKGTGSGLTAALLNGTSDVVAGTITWSFDLDPGNDLADHLFGPGIGGMTDVTMTFLSNNFVTSAAGRLANSYLEDSGTFFLTLWGADNYAGDYSTATLGTDLVVDPTFPVPEPAPLALFAIGLLGLLAAGRPRRAPSTRPNRGSGSERS